MSICYVCLYVPCTWYCRSYLCRLESVFKFHCFGQFSILFVLCVGVGWGVLIWSLAIFSFILLYLVINGILYIIFAIITGVDILLNKESKRETPSVVTFTTKQRMIGTSAGMHDVYDRICVLYCVQEVMKTSKFTYE